MIITPQTFQLAENKMVFNKVFVPGQSAWEMVDTDSERTFIKNNHYYMENLTEGRWNYYKNKMPANIGENWMIETSIELLSRDQYGHFGIVWGFDEEREHLNRFTVSADGERGVVMHFQKDHHRVYHRYQKNFSDLSTSYPVNLAVLKLDNYFYFLVERQLMYICEQSHMANYGNGFGYYIEPGLFVRSSYMTVNRLTLNESRRSKFDSLFF
jgi:hypothetical protein